MELYNGLAFTAALSTQSSSSGVHAGYKQQVQQESAAITPSDSLRGREKCEQLLLGKIVPSVLAAISHSLMKALAFWHT